MGKGKIRRRLDEFKRKISAKKKKVKSKFITPDTTTDDKKYSYYDNDSSTLKIGTRKEITDTYPHADPTIVSDTTVKKLEAHINFIDEGYIKKVEAALELRRTDKIEFENGSEISLDAKFEAQATAMIDLSKLLVELGVKLTAGVTAELKSAKLNLGSVTIQGFLQAVATVEAEAKLTIKPGQILAEAKAVAEAKVALGGTFSRPILGDSEYSIEIKPQVEAYAKAEASAMAAAGKEKGGFKVDASAAVGVRASVTATVKGNAEVKDDAEPTKPAVTIKDAALGSVKIEVEVNLVAGGDLEVTYEFKDETDGDTKLEYKTGNAKIAGGVLIGIGGSIEGKILKPLYEDFKDKLKAKIVSVLHKMISDKVFEKYDELKEKADEIVEAIKNSATKYLASFVDLIGFHSKGVKMELERQNLKIVNAFGELMGSTEEDRDKNLAYLRNRYAKYNDYLTSRFTEFEVQITGIAKKINTKLSGMSESTEEEKAALADVIKKVEGVSKLMRKIGKTMESLIDLANVDPEFFTLEDESVMTTMTGSARKMIVLTNYLDNNILRGLTQQIS
ncbi:MAG: hypothetical protein GY810_03040 [Aureispira sp.]|nr:hypothetical protein [Aureispira sp.]